MRLFVPGPLPGLNELLKASGGAGGTRAHYARLKRSWTDTVVLLARAAKLPRMERAHLTFRWLEKSRRRDPDNVVAGGRKLILDGLVKAGVLPGDGWEHVAGFHDTWDLAGRPGVEVWLTEQPP